MITPPGEWGRRALRLREALMLIGPLVGPEAVLRRHHASSVTMDLLMVIEAELAEQVKKDMEDKK